MPNPFDNALPCPFCGGKDLATPPGIGIVVCGTCSGAGPAATPHPNSDVLTVVAAVSKWNNRTPMPTEETPDADD